MDTKPGHTAKLLGVAPAAPKPPPAAPGAPVPPTAQAPTAPTAPSAPKPPASHVKPPTAPSTSSPSTASPSTSGGSGSGSTGSGGSGSGNTGSGTHHNSSSGTTNGKGSSSGSAGFSTGDTPYAAQIFENGGDTHADHANTAGQAADADTSTAWTSSDYPSGFGTKGGVGIYVDTGGYTTYTALGLVTSAPGFDVQIYSTTQDPAPGTLSGWTKVTTKKSVSARQKINLPTSSATPRYYLIWITKLAPGKKNASISEVALLQ